MNNGYLAALITIGLLLLFFFLVRKYNLLKSTMMLLIVFIAVAGASIYENFQYAHVAKAVQSVKLWLQSSENGSSQKAIAEPEPEIVLIKESVLLHAPPLSQMPELPRGCEVTSLAMLLNDRGINVDKLTLAKEVRKNPADYKLTGGKIYFGDPNEGFVGNMYTYSEPGLGVYHKPIAELAEKYLPGQIKDLTGKEFTELKIQLSDDRPVWVIINTQYKKLADSYFQTWYTPSGTVKVTSKEHSVLVTGYDHDYVYFNDPLTGEKNKKAPIHDFEQSWVQMGRQAITYREN